MQADPAGAQRHPHRQRPEALKYVSMVGNDLRLDEGIGVCGKEGQSVPVGWAFRQFG